MHLTAISSESDLVPYSAQMCLEARSVLVLAPHPDDEVFGCGGAIRSHVLNGVEVGVVVLTDGALYGDATAREQESIAAARVLGYGVPEFWQQPDRGLVCSDVLVHRLVAKVVELGVDLVYAPSPWEVHPDHRQAYLLAVAAARQCTQPVRLALYEVGSAMRPNVLVDISLHADTKTSAMLCFASQLKQQNYGVHMQALNQYRTYTLGSDVLMAEAFWLTTPDDLDQHLSGSLQSFISRGTISKAAVDPSATEIQSTPVSVFQRLKNWWAQVFN